jgi:uncharacterized protein
MGARGAVWSLCAASSYDPKRRCNRAVENGTENSMDYIKLDEAECHEILRRVRFGRLGCARDNQPYVIPIHFAFDGDSIYGFASLGQKIDWMRANPLVCLEVDEIVDFNVWSSVVVFGSYEELTDAPECEEARRRATMLLESRGKWLEPAYAATRVRDDVAAPSYLVYRIRVDEMNGRRARPGAWAVP